MKLLHIATSLMEGPGSSMRSALRSEPERLRRERTALQHHIQDLSLKNFQVHIANVHCEENVRSELDKAVEMLPALSGVVSGLASESDSLESDLSKLHGEHTRLRRTLNQHNALLELLEAPSVMEACVRSGMLDEALDVADYATTLFFTHKLWATAMATNSEPDSPPSDGAKKPTTVINANLSSANSGAAEIIRQIVAEIRGIASDMRDGILAQLSGGRVTLPIALKLLGHLRRLYTQQALARKRALTHLSAASTASAAGALTAVAVVSPSPSSSSLSASPAAIGAVSTAAPVLDASAFAMTPEEDAAIVKRVRLEFLSCRDSWHRGDLETIPRHNTYQYVSAEVLLLFLGLPVVHNMPSASSAVPIVTVFDKTSRASCLQTLRYPVAIF